MNWFAPILVFASLSVRTPYIQPNPMDYEVSVGFEKNSVYANYQWERELGAYYQDQEYWVSGQSGHFVGKEKYIHKESRDINYNQADFRYQYGGWSAGYALRHVRKVPSHRLVTAYNLDKRFNIFVAKGQMTVDGEMTTDFQLIDYTLRGVFQFGILQNLDLSLVLRTEKSGNNDFFQGKVRLDLNIPEV